MSLYFLFKGIVLGFAIAAPVGPVGILCITRSLSNGRLSGILTGLGAASADAIYGAIAAFGLTAIMTLLMKWQLCIEAIGGIFLLLVGIKIFFSKPKDNFFSERSGDSIVFDYTSTFFLTIANPMTILAFMGVFAALGGGGGGYDLRNAMLLVIGVFLGSTLWWLVLTNLVGWLHKKLNTQVLTWINRGSGIIIIICVIFIFFNIIRLL